MTNYERRMELLNQTKQAHNSMFRFDSNKPTDKTKSTLGTRIMICMICFICYILFDYGNMQINNVNSNTVKNQIKYEMNLQNIQEKMH